MGWAGPFHNLAFVWEGLGPGRRTEGQGVRGHYRPSQGVDHRGNDLAQVKMTQNQMRMRAPLSLLLGWNIIPRTLLLYYIF